MHCSSSLLSLQLKWVFQLALMRRKQTNKSWWASTNNLETVYRKAHRSSHTFPLFPRLMLCTLHVLIRIYFFPLLHNLSLSCTSLKSTIVRATFSFVLLRKSKYFIIITKQLWMILKLDRTTASLARWLDPRIIISNCHCVPRVSGGLFSREHLDVQCGGGKEGKKDSRERKIWRRKW